MFKRILIPLDGSERAERAIPVAIRAAHSVGGSILLLRVVNTAAEHYPSAPSKPALLQSNVMAETRLAESYLGALAKSDRFRGLSVQTRVLSGSGCSFDSFLASAEEADVIIMCSHGYSGITRWVLGSVAEKVAHHADMPVLILRENGPIPTEQETVKESLQVCVPLDGSAFAEAALVPAATLASVLAAPGQGKSASHAHCPSWGGRDGGSKALPGKHKRETSRRFFDAIHAPISTSNLLAPSSLIRMLHMRSLMSPSREEKEPPLALLSLPSLHTVTVDKPAGLPAASLGAFSMPHHAFVDR